MNLRELDLNALKVFERVAATGSFTAAARHFHRAVSSVSRQIGALEQSVGQPLLYRHTRAVALTEAGARYYEEIRLILDQLNLATEALANPSPEPAGVLRINAPVAFGQRQVVPLLNQFQQKYPSIKAELFLTDQVIDPISGGHDITFRVGNLADSALISRRLAPMNYVVAASPQYTAQHGAPVSPDELVNHNCLVYQGELGRQRWFFQGHGNKDTLPVEVSGNLYSNDPESLVRAALLAQGLIIFPTWLISAELSAGTLIPLLQDWRSEVSDGRRDLYVLTQQRHSGVSKVRSFLDYLFESVTPHASWDRWERDK